MPRYDLHAGGLAGAGGNSTAETSRSSPKVYKYVIGGVTTYSDRAPLKAAYVALDFSCYACNPASRVNWQAIRLHRDKFTAEIEQAAAKFGIDAALVRAVIHAESGFNVLARSPKGAIGLMQLMPATAREVGVTDVRNPAQNIHGGVRYLAGLLHKFQGNTTLATAAYNAGPAAVEKYSGVPPYAETEAYVKRVHILRQRYQSGHHQ